MIDRPQMASRFLILCTEGGSDFCLWWKPNRCGYTRDFDSAGRYTQEEYEDAVPLGRRHDNVLVPEEVAEAAAKAGPRAVRWLDLPAEVRA